ncbi:unnamed protein product, partial [Cuscuta epithymum]
MASLHCQLPSATSLDPRLIRSLEKGLDEWRKIIQDPKSQEKKSWTQFAGGSCGCSYNLLNNNGYQDYYSYYTEYDEDCFPRVNGARNNVFVSMAKTQEGSLELQNLVKYGTPMDRQEVLDGILRGIFEVIIDPYGHILIHRLLDFCDSK